MPLTGKFLADFESFFAAVQKADVELRGMETGAGKVEKSLNRMADAFSGRKIIQDATVAAEAVERIGGATKLTEAEQARLNRTLTEAIAKYAALGQEAPANLVKLAEDTKKVQASTDAAASSTTNWKAGLLAAAGAVGVTFSAGAVIAFGKRVFDSASQIHDLADQLGISTDAVQGFKFAAEQSGSTLENVGTALTKMNANLAGGDKATVQALKDAGLGFSAIRNLKPEDAFLAITDAIQKIPDPMVQSDVALQLFGRSAASLLPGIKEGFRGAADGAAKMSKDTIDSLEAAQDAWGRLADKVTIVTGGVVAEFLKIPDATKRVTSSLTDLSTFMTDVALNGWANAILHANKLTDALNKNKDINLPLEGAIKKTAEQLAAEAKAAADAAAAMRRHAESIQQLHDKYSGADLARRVKDLSDAMRGLGAGSDLRLLADDIGKLAQQGAKLTPEMVQIAISFGTLTPKTISLAEAFKGLGGQIYMTIPEMVKINEAINKLNPDPKAVGISNLKSEFAALVVVSPADMLKGVQVKAVDAGKALGELSQAFSQLAQIAGGRLGSVVQDMGTLISAANTAKKSVDSIKSGFEAKGTLSGILDMTTGIVGIASAAIAAGKAVAALFDRNKGRDVVVDFAQTFGGFDQLHAQLLVLGDAGEALWIKLTQGVGRNNPGQAQAVIDEITAALKKQESQTGETQSATEEQAVATIETASQAQAALDELGVRLTENVDEWATWGSAVRGVIDGVAAAIRSMPIPTGTGLTYGAGATSILTPQATGSAARASAAPRGRSGNTVVQFVTPSMKVLAEGVLPELPGAMAAAGI